MTSQFTRKCEKCYNDYKGNPLNFRKDPKGKLCNNCYIEENPEPEEPETLGIDVSDSIETTDHFGN